MLPRLTGQGRRCLGLCSIHPNDKLASRRLRLCIIRLSSPARQDTASMLKPDLIMLITAVVALIHTCGVLSAVHAVAGVRTPQGAIAWAISLLTFPYIALPLYWILGRNRFHGYVETLQRGALEQADRGGIAMILEGLRGHQIDLPPERAGDLQVLAQLSHPLYPGQCPGTAGRWRGHVRRHFRRARGSRAFCGDGAGSSDGWFGQRGCSIRFYSVPI